MTQKPPTGGIAHRMIDQQHYLYAGAWQRAHDCREIVGACRSEGCGGHLHTLPTHQVGSGAGQITWYAAECDTCQTQIASPNLRTLARSGRHAEMPDGWWDRRQNHLRKMADLSKNMPGGDDF